MTILGLILYFNDFSSCCSVAYILEHSFIRLKACCSHTAVAIEPVVSSFCVRTRCGDTFTH